MIPRQKEEQILVPSISSMMPSLMGLNPDCRLESLSGDLKKKKNKTAWFLRDSDLIVMG